jgi:hypothetical protein
MDKTANPLYLCIMSSKHKEKVLDVVGGFQSPSIIADIDALMMDLWEARKFAVRLHGETVPSPFALVASVSEAALVAASPAVGSKFDGTVSGLISRYRSDPDSTYQKLSFSSRKSYDDILNRLEKDHGSERIADLHARDMLRWHEAWTASGLTMAHSLIRMFRGVLSFGTTILEDAECTRLSTVLRHMRFKMADVRSARLTLDHVNLIRKEARRRQYDSIALAQALQFECNLRQREVIGEWVPKSEPGPALAEWKDQKWQRGLLWSDIDENMILRRTVGKRNTPIEINLRQKSMVMEELAGIGALPKFGPVIVNERTRRPWTVHHFRETWRQIADAAGVPKDVRNADSRMSTSRASANGGDVADDESDEVDLDMEFEQGAQQLPH